MKELPPDDPRNFFQQANVHCAYCEAAYPQVNFPELDIQVHHSWLFFPFHRWFIYFFERILGSLIEDPTFALPFWNWDDPSGMTIPPIYADYNSSLYDPLRDHEHQPPVLVDLDYNLTYPNMSSTDMLHQTIVNKKTMYRCVVVPKLSNSFLGSPYRAGMNRGQFAGSVERAPHNNVHDWIGDRNQPNVEDMGVLYAAARDPIFFAHHSNVDRIWDIWKTKLGNKDFTDPDFLDSSFLFYDERKRLVRVKVRDCLDPKTLGYKYQEVDIPWMVTKPTPLVPIEERQLNKAKKAIEAIPNVEQVFPAKLDKVVRAWIERPKKTRSSVREVEILVIEEIELDPSKYVKFDVLVNDEGASSGIGPEHTEFAGSFGNLRHMHKMGKMMKTSMRLEITELLHDLESDGDDALTVTLIPIAGCEDVTIGGVKIEYDTPGE